MNNESAITIENTVNAPVEAVWNFWTKPEHITKWNSASDDWHTPIAENDLRVGGKFLSRMEARDGSFGFDFAGVYTEVITNELIDYTMSDDRQVRVAFETAGNSTKIVSTFEPESENSIEMQRDGWQAILDNFKKYAESNHKSNAVNQ
ncbi:MAG: SRPBCC family protein [Pyrinomonadaceae bacterium]